MSDTTNDGWADVKDAASKMFNLWCDGRELEWAREAWGHLFLNHRGGGGVRDK